MSADPTPLTPELEATIAEAAAGWGPGAVGHYVPGLLAEIRRLRAVCLESLGQGVALASRLHADLQAARRRVEGLCERVAVQAELLERRAERQAG